MSEASDSTKSKRQRNLRTKRAGSEEAEAQQPCAVTTENASTSGAGPDVQRDKMEEMRLLQKLRKKSGGTSAKLLAMGAKDDLLEAAREGSPQIQEEGQQDTRLMDTFSKATVVATSEEDPNMQKFIEQELARRLGKRVDDADGADADPEVRKKRQELEMYKIPEEYKSNLSVDAVVPGMNTIITEVPLAVSTRLKNIEDVERMKKRMLGDRDDGGSSNQGTIKRNQFVPQFGVNKLRRLTRDELEDESKRMRHVSERKPALPTRKLHK